MGWCRRARARAVCREHGAPGTGCAVRVVTHVKSVARFGRLRSQDGRRCEPIRAGPRKLGEARRGGEANARRVRSCAAVACRARG